MRDGWEKAGDASDAIEGGASQGGEGKSRRWKDDLLPVHQSSCEAPSFSCSHHKLESLQWMTIRIWVKIYIWNGYHGLKRDTFYLWQKMHKLKIKEIRDKLQFFQTCLSDLEPTFSIQSEIFCGLWSLLLHLYFHQVHHTTNSWYWLLKLYLRITDHMYKGCRGAYSLMNKCISNGKKGSKENICNFSIYTEIHINQQWSIYLNNQS